MRRSMSARSITSRRRLRRHSKELSFSAWRGPLGLKVGVHRGRAIAVTLNDRIDYFGQDVNIAARVQGLADVNEICISATVMEAPGVGDIVKSRGVSRNYENLKGIGQQMEVHRITITPTQT